MPDVGITHPFPEPPLSAAVIEVAPGILWARIPLPFRLDHVNVYLLQDDDGWAVIDTGIFDETTRHDWAALLSGPLAGQRITKIIVTHFHSDHMGSAGWLCRQTGAPLLTSQTSYLMSVNITLDPDAMQAAHYQDFYKRHGMSEETAGLVSTLGHRYMTLTDKVPPTFGRLVVGDRLRIGDRQFEIMTGDGHAPEQLMLYSPADAIFFAADQVLAKITPNISVNAVEPNGDPLGLYLRSLDLLKRTIPADVLVLPGHQLPFRGLPKRCDELRSHHEDRCRMIEEACRAFPRSVADLMPILFPKVVDPHQLGFAFAEVHAHVNYLRDQGTLIWQDEAAALLKVCLA